MGCSGSKATTTDAPDDIDCRNVDDTQDDYPPPYIPELSRDHVYDPEVIDNIQKKINEMPAGTDSKYSTLLNHLSEGLTKEVHHVTAIYLWMKSQNYEDESLDMESPGDTPRGYMKMIKDGEGDHTTFFTILCRRSGIQCMILRGIGKSDEYYIGRAEKKMKTKWAAVYADDEWHLVHVLWAMREAKDGNQNDKNPEVSDFYFLTDPDKFALMCSPEDFRWQLLNRAYSKREFMSFPNFRPHFFLLNAGVLTPETGTIKTSRSKTQIELSFPKKAMENIHVHFNYYFVEHLKANKQDDDDDDKEEEVKSLKIPKRLEKYVFVDRKATKFIFEIGLPAAGKYLFDIYGAVEDKEKQSKQNSQDSENKGENKDEPGEDREDNAEDKNEDSDSNDYRSNKDTPLDSLDKLCQFRLIAEIDPEPRELESNPDSPSNGWGPGPRCRDLGLIAVSHLESCIYMKPGDKQELKFKMTKKLDIMTQLVHDYLPIYELVEQVDCSTKGKNVAVRVQIPEEGRYALKIFTREKGTKEFKETCVYLIRQRVPTRFNEKYRDKMLRTRLEYHIENNTSEMELQDALELHQFYFVPDQGEKDRAYTKLKDYWEVKRELDHAIMGRNHWAVRKWLQRAKQSEYEPEIQGEIQRAEALYDKLSRNKGYLHPVARMDQSTMIEIKNYKHPPMVIHKVMGSTYMLLGERKEDIWSWEQIQYLMGKENVQKRIMNRHVDDVDPEVAREADENLKDCSLEKCRETSTGIGVFYKWCKQFIHDGKQRDMNDTAREDEDRSLAGRETYRDMLSRDQTQGSQTSNGDIRYYGREPSDKAQDRHPFSIQEESDSEKVSARDRDGDLNDREGNQRFMPATQPESQRKQEPVSSYGV